MKKKLMSIALSAVLLCGALPLAACGESESGEKGEAVLTVDGKKEAFVYQNADGKDVTGERKISDDLFGIFLEDINYAGDSLNSELVQNKSFNYPVATRAWSKVNGAEMEVKKGGGICENNNEYALVTASAASAGIANAGFVEGMAVEKGLNYTFSVYVRAGSYDGGLTAKIVVGDKTLAETKIAVKSEYKDEWVRYESTLTPSETANQNVSLQLLLDKAGEVEVDCVSLDPTNNQSGFRKDLYDAMVELTPHFVRFPGGCIIEGRVLEEAFDWKDSIGVDRVSGKATSLTTKVVKDGAVSEETVTGTDATRPSGGNIWTKTTDYGIGFYEYFTLCDDMGVTAVPVINCGYACMGGLGTGKYVSVKSEEMQYYIQNAIDLIAFAKGSVTSSDANEAYWAQVRTDMGHAEPFKMDYLGIGNEQWGDPYYEHYEAVLNAIREKGKTNPLYNTVEPIVGTGPLFWWTENGGGNADPMARKRMNSQRKAGYVEKLSDYGTVDEHYYMNYTDFLDYNTKYDTYSRNEKSMYHVFVGEYSANTDTDIDSRPYDFVYNSIQSATAEAAYMTAIERNGDVVSLAAYAPVFAHRNARYNQWGVDMMYYTNNSLVRSCNYFVQQMFMQNQGDYVLKSSLKYAKEAEEKSTFVVEGLKDKTEDSLYYVASLAKNGDLIVKVVNANPEESVKVQIKATDFNFSGKGELTVLQSDDKGDLNQTSEDIVPVKTSVDAKNGFVFEAKQNSVNIIRFSAQ